MPHFKIIPVTAPDFIANETEAICALFEKCNLPLLHIRKPFAAEEELRLFTRKIPARYHNRLHLHDHHVLHKEFSGEFSLGGLHLNKRNPVVPDNFSGILSYSCHSFEEVRNALATGCSYVFLSPIFDSISKQGYVSGFTAAEIAAHNLDKIIALGGVTSDNIPLLQKWGFAGAAIIGSLWNRFSESGNIEDLISDYRKLEYAANQNVRAAEATLKTQRSRRANAETRERTEVRDRVSNEAQRRDLRNLELPRVMFITHCNTHYNYIQSAETALKGGIRWIQYRHKQPVSPQEQQEELSAIAALCKQYGALLTINDYPELAADTDGLHVGLNDISVAKARKILDDNTARVATTGTAATKRTIIGGTANTFEHIEKHLADGANYVGVGPFRHTETKKNLSSILGLQGYKDIVRQCHYNNTTIPIYAIGGIRLEDIPALMNTGIYGIAISSLILDSNNPIETTKEILNLVM